MDGLTNAISMPGMSGLGGLGARMSAAGVSTLSTAADSPEAVRLVRQQDFSAMLGKTVEKAGNPGPHTEEARAAEAKQAAEDFVAIAFVVPILKQFRETNNAAPPFAPSTGEKQFRALADAQTARQIVRSSNFPIVERIARDLARYGRGGGET